MAVHQPYMRKRVRHAGAKRVGGITPQVFAVVGSVHTFFIVKGVYGHRISAVGQAHQNVGNAEPHIPAVITLPETLPFGEFGGIEDPPNVAGLVQLREAFHVHKLGRGRGNEGGMRRSRHRRHLFQKLQVFRMLAELVIANQRAIRLAAEYSELFFVNFLEGRALIEFRGALQVPQKVLLGDIQHPDLQHGAGFALADQVLQASPTAFQLLKRGMVKDFVELDGEQMVNLRNARIDHRLGVFGDGYLALQNLGDELFHQTLAAFPSGGVRSHPPRLDNLIEKRLFTDLLGGLRLLRPLLLR